MKKWLLIFSLLPLLLHAQGGMWLPLLLEKQNEKEMRALGCKLKADDIYSAVKPSIKDAICQFNGGCTGEMISPQGLLLTNHHCGFDNIQELSSLQNNYVDNGFWAKNQAEELPCPGATAKFIRRMEDVTALALLGVTDLMGERERQSQVDKNIAQIRGTTKKEAWEETEVRPFYQGNQYFLFVTVTYRDVRLVGAPPASIGKFGADTDNWSWPRHTGDFSLFRVYADADNRPAPYSPDNRPYKPLHFLPISLKGVKEGEFTMIYGFPGRTNEYLPAIAVQQTAEILNPARIEVCGQTLNIMDGFMRRDQDIKIAYVTKQADIANVWKKWRGESLGLRVTGALAKKRAYEADFTARIKNNPDLNYRFGNVLPRMEQLYRDIEPYALARDYYQEIFLRNTELFRQIAALNPWLDQYDKGGLSAMAARLEEVKTTLQGFVKDYRPVVDQAVVAAQMALYVQKMPAEYGGGFVQTAITQHTDAAGLAAHLFASSALTRPDTLRALLAGDALTFVRRLRFDPAVAFWRGVTAAYQSKVAPKIQELQPQINLLQRQYMAGQMTVLKEKRFFPDANSTLRLTYGPARGYRPRDAVQYDYRSYLDGVMEKYVPGDYEFDVPARLRELWEKKDYGRYATPDGRMPVAFLGANHTTGGNSGSPALDAKGHLVGLNFDRVWEGTMSDLYYDPAICRNIMVDLRYILFIIEKMGNCRWLIDEMSVK
jgi:Peptidase S46